LRRPARDDAPSIVALGSHIGLLRCAVLNLKFRHRVQAAIELGTILGRKLAGYRGTIVAVPLHKKRLRARGFNQAEKIAQGVALALGAPLVDDMIIRPGATREQSSLPLAQRQANVRNAFEPGFHHDCLMGRNVLLVDDVVTTGATIAGCARVLRQCGVRSVRAAALAIRI
jgi:ComF family protein